MDLALADYNKAIQINPDLVEAYINRGVLYMHQEKWELAIVDYNKAIDINPNLAHAYAVRGIVMFKVGNKQKAIQDLQKAAQLSKAQSNTALYKSVIHNLQKIQQ